MNVRPQRAELSKTRLLLSTLVTRQSLEKLSVSPREPVRSHRLSLVMTNRPSTSVQKKPNFPATDEADSLCVLTCGATAYTGRMRPACVTQQALDQLPQVVRDENSTEDNILRVVN